MTVRTAAVLNIVVSLIFAAAIIISGRMLKGTDHGQTVTFLLIAAWWIPFTWLTHRGGTGCRRAKTS